MQAVTRKNEMYAMLAQGLFGNTIPQFFSVDDWLRSPDSRRYHFWGVRSARTAAHPACKLHVPAGEVPAYARLHFPDGPNISMMVDAIAEVYAWLEIWDSPSGLVVEGVEHPRVDEGWNWRNSMPEPSRRRHWEGVAATMVLRRHLNANSFHDLQVVMENFPGHVVELSALNKAIGTMPHRNAVVWEVRKY